MPPAKSDDIRHAARSLYMEGQTFKAIARSLGVTDRSVSNWAHEDKWKRPKRPGVPKELADSKGNLSREKLLSLSAIDDKVLRRKSIVALCDAFLRYALRGLYEISQVDPSIGVYDKMANHSKSVVVAYREERSALIRSIEVSAPKIAETYRDEPKEE